HRLHSMDFLLSAYLQVGDDRDALKQIDGLKSLPENDSMIPSYNDYYQEALILFPATYAIERGQWKEALKIVPDPATPPYVQATACWVRAVAAGHLRDAAVTRAALHQFSTDFEATKKSSKAYLADDLETKRDEALAWQRHADGRDDEAVKLMRDVADKEDKVGKRETDIPAREMLADLLLEIGRSDDALQEYELSLKTNPNRFNALYGAGRAAEAVKQPEKARQYYAQLLKNCSGVESDRPELARVRAAMTESR
ncbi:MAG TPA: tetratricopeptide repeat protein, partial [Acidobacteriota bacterium]|nr:tetratricopeptide repeat protein [Acidobacteriota bacterium]